MNRKAERLRQEVRQIQAELSEQAELRAIFQLCAEDTGEPVGLVDFQGNPVSADELGPREVVFKMTDRMLRLLSCGMRYILAEGGRGSAKSYSIAQYIIGASLEKPERILCAREVMASIRHSVRELLVQIIQEDDRLIDFFEVQRDQIYGKNGSEFLFRGLREIGIDAVRSFQGLNKAWIEEGQSITRRSWDVLTPTIREPGSQIFVSMNRRYDTDCLYKEFLETEHPRGATDRFNYLDNPWCPDVLIEDAEDLRERNPARYQHVYMGEIENLSDSRIFNNWSVLPEDFDIQSIIDRSIENIRVGYQGSTLERSKRYQKVRSKIENDYHFGGDLGYSDATALIYLYRDPDAKELFIVDEHYEPGLTGAVMATKLKDFQRRQGKDRWPIYLDNSRPEMIALLRDSYGINSKPCVKMLIKERIDLLQQWTIFIHPRCVNTIREFGLYSWKLNANGDPIPVPQDKDNHTIDAVFYSLGINLRDTKRRMGMPKGKRTYGRC